MSVSGQFLPRQPFAIEAVTAQLRPRVQRRKSAAGGHFVICTDKITNLDGPPPQRFVLIAFGNVEKAQAWHNSAAQKEDDAARAKTTDSLSFMVDGLTN
jgi:uncharacterized protein (DUF1330 family)